VVPYIAAEHEQGRHILGSFADLLAVGGTHFRVSPTPANAPAFQLSVNPAGPGGVNGTHLVANDGLPPADHVGADPWFVGLILDGPGGQLRIRGFATIGTSIIGPSITSTMYFLDYRWVAPGNTGPWEDYCGDAGSGAIPISGYYDSRRIHQPGPWISFACRDGVARKCNDWRYPPGIGGPGNPNWDHHQACTAMANADYCRTGEPYTHERTPILLRDYAENYAAPYPSDIEHPSPFPGDPDEYYFEAGWRPGDLGPVCLSKIRWAGLPPDPCPATLPDPRFSDDKRARFCDDLTMAEIQSLGAILVNASKMMDAPLHRWKNPATGDIVSTIRGFLIDRDGTPGADAGSKLPFPGYSLYLGGAGMVLRNLPGTLEPSDVYPLYMQLDPATLDRVVARDPVADHVVGELEGYTFRSATAHEAEFPDLIPLKVWECASGADYRTATGAPPGCVLEGSLGYAMPAP
jgi:hypothetical protein